jgi:fatty-acyl-CoA synthase
MDSSDIELHSMPLFLCAQQHCFLVPDIYLGATSLIFGAPEPDALLESIAIMPVEILREITERLRRVRLWNFYGQTEMAPVAVMLQPEDQIRKASAAGRTCLNVETRLVDPEGNDVAVGEVGEIVHRSPHAILAYLDDPEKTAEAFRGEWFHSGDLGTLDDEGYLTVVDRIKDMIKTSRQACR